MSVEVVTPGVLTSVQDAFGRAGWRHLGVPAGGAADAWSARLANRLVGNPDGAALLEITHSGPGLRFETEGTIALVGAFDAAVDGLPWSPGSARRVRAGAAVQVGAGREARGYLAIGGGILVELVLGSPSTDLRTGFGGLEGRALRAADRLRIGEPGGRGARWTGSAGTGPIRIVAGPHADAFAPDALDAEWRIGREADRIGVRLDGPTLVGRVAEVPSTALPLGAVQVPSDGRPIVMLADRPVTGGYPVPAVVIRADIGRVARLRPGDEVRFARVSLEEARRAWRDAESALGSLEPINRGDDALEGWAGAHE